LVLSPEGGAGRQLYLAPVVYAARILADAFFLTIAFTLQQNSAMNFSAQQAHIATVKELLAPPVTPLPACKALFLQPGTHVSSGISREP
jgi:hypothetical protein